MRIAIVGGGPAGLYLAILMRRSRPDAAVTVYERNRLEDTFGFGVVFSDQTLDNFERADPESYAAILAEFAYWDDIEIRHKGAVHRIGGNGFCGFARTTLLRILARRAAELGADLRFRAEVASVEALEREHDLVVVSDGINSATRAAHAEHFGPAVDLRPNRFVWMGSTCPLDAFTFAFEETPHGVLIAHAYQYEGDPGEAGRSTWIFECTDETFAAMGLDPGDEAGSAREMEAVFAAHLKGHRLITNRSIWRNFPMVRNARWVRGSTVLLGDAKATAHYSIGSGTKLAMEDAIALHDALMAGGTVGEALARFESGRREEVEKTQHAADVSLVWFEHVRRFWDFDPTQFAFGIMTRSKAITYDNLALRAPEFVAEADRVFARGVREAGFDVDAEDPVPPLFQPMRLRGMTLRNRAVVSPMCMYSAREGVPGDWHLVHYGARGIGGAGLVFTEMVTTSPEARITPGCAGLWSDEQEEAWARIVGFVHAHGEARMCLQLGHAGRKGATRLMWEGMDRPLAEGAWPIVSASAIPYHPESQVPRALDRAGMDRVRDEFVAAARRGARAGFDMLELHCAHGYLLASFLSPLTNRREDDYGGPLENRLRFPLEVFSALREAWPEDRPMSVRLSATDWQEGGVTGEEAVAVARAFAEADVDLVDVSTGQTTPEARPVYGRMFQTSFADRIRNEARVATMAVGAITTADQMNTILAAGRADLVALGRPHLADPSFVARAAGWYGVEVATPPQYLPGRDQLLRLAARERAELEELRRKARPKRRAARRRGDPSGSLAAE